MLEGLNNVLARIQEIKSHFRGMGVSGAVTIAPHYSASSRLQANGVEPFIPGNIVRDVEDSVKGAIQDVSAYDELINSSASKYNIDPALLKALIHAESGFKPNAVSPAGAMGLTQLMPATAAALNVSDPFDPTQSIDGGARYLRAQLDRFGGDESLALAAYNAGPGAVIKYGGIPPYSETQRFVNRVLALREVYLR
ncbi:MAG: lytic transglycosylase domain-containing protein [Armatimonadota bacterium]